MTNRLNPFERFDQNRPIAIALAYDGYDIPAPWEVVNGFIVAEFTDGPIAVQIRHIVSVRQTNQPAAIAAADQDPT